VIAVDYRKFLGRTESMVLPYLGGASIDAPDRRLRVAARPAPGWYACQIEGRNAALLAPAAAPDLSGLPAVRGHLSGAWLFAEGPSASPVMLFPDGDEPEPLSACTARRWYSDDLLFDGVEFDAGPEPDARLSLEEQAPLTAPGAPPSLRAAYGFALCSAVARELRLRVSPVEVLGLLAGFARLGRAETERALLRIAQERLLARALGDRTPSARPSPQAPELASPARAPAAVAELSSLRPQLVALPVSVPVAVPTPSARASHAAPAARSRQGAAAAALRRSRSQPAPTLQNAPERAEAALDAAGAAMRSARVVARGSLEVTYRFMGERFITVVDALTLQVIDAGICLAGADRQATLDSMPSIIKEAIETHLLVITRH
jgi:hypothetical protein